MFARSPREVVEGLPVGIEPLPRIALVRTQLRIPLDNDDGESLIGEARSCIQANRTRRKAAVLGKESFGKPVPAKARFVDLVRTKYRNKGDRHKLHACRGKGVEP